MFERKPLESSEPTLRDYKLKLEDYLRKYRELAKKNKGQDVDFHLQWSPEDIEWYQKATDEMEKMQNVLGISEESVDVLEREIIAKLEKEA